MSMHDRYYEPDDDGYPDDWIYRAIEECLENKEDIAAYKLEAVS